VYRSDSIAYAWLLDISLAKERMCVSIVTSDRYYSKQKLVLIVQLVNSLPPSGLGWLSIERFQLDTYLRFSLATI
jgi:hypothetical protein